MFRLLLVALFLFVPLSAKDHKDRDHGDDDHQGYSHGDHDQESDRIRHFSDGDKEIIIKYYKNKKIPPGHRKNGNLVTIVINQPASPEILKIAMPLPVPLLPLLPPPPPGISILMVDDKVIRMDKKSKTILDCFPLLPPPLFPPIIPLW